MRAQLLLPDQTTLNFALILPSSAKLKILKTRASIDGLTQCFNRDEILHQLEQLLKAELEQQQAQLPFCVFMLDLFDHFKSINDTWGHLAGDESLIPILAAYSALSNITSNAHGWTFWWGRIFIDHAGNLFG